MDEGNLKFIVKNVKLFKRQEEYCKIVKDDFLNYFNFEGQLQPDTQEEFLAKIQPILKDQWKKISPRDILISYANNGNCKLVIQELKKKLAVSDKQLSQVNLKFVRKRVALGPKQQEYLSLVNEQFINFFEANGEVSEEKRKSFLKKLHPILKARWGGISKNRVFEKYINHNDCKLVIQELKKNLSAQQVPVTSEIPYLSSSSANEDVLTNGNERGLNEINKMQHDTLCDRVINELQSNYSISGGTDVNVLNNSGVNSYDSNDIITNGINKDQQYNEDSENTINEVIQDSYENIMNIGFIEDEQSSAVPTNVTNVDQNVNFSISIEFDTSWNTSHILWNDPAAQETSGITDHQYIDTGYPIVASLSIIQKSGTLDEEEAELWLRNQRNQTDPNYQLEKEEESSLEQLYSTQKLNDTLSLNTDDSSFLESHHSEKQPVKKILIQ